MAGDRARARSKQREHELCCGRHQEWRRPRRHVHVIRRKRRRAARRHVGDEGVESPRAEIDGCRSTSGRFCGPGLRREVCERFGRVRRSRAS